MDFHVDPSVLALTFISVDIGVSGVSGNNAGQPMDVQVRGMVETVAIGAIAATVTKSWWPIIGPVAYLAFDYIWSTQRDHAPEVLAAEKDVYDNGS